MENGSEITDNKLEKDLENILASVAQSQNFKNYNIFSNNDSTKGDGFLSVFFTGEVLNEDNGETIQVAIKRAPTGGISVGVEYEDIYKNEINFYSHVFPILDKYQQEKKVKYPFQHIPRYFSGSQGPTNIFLAMENLKTRGYVLFDKKEYFDDKHLELIFKTYGKLHALSFSFKQKNEEEFENLTSNFTDLLKKFTESNSEVAKLIDRAYSAALKAFNPITEANILVKLKKAGNAVEILKSCQEYRGVHKCLTHGDCWSNNMLFKYKESGELEDIKLIDFQLARASTPVHDLSYFFYSGASKEAMDKLDYYLDLYYQSFSKFARELGENPEEIFPLEILKEEWKEYGAYGIILSCQLWLGKLMDRDEISSVLEQSGLTQKEHWSLFESAWTTISEGQTFKERTKNILLHAVEHGIIIS